MTPPLNAELLNLVVDNGKARLPQSTLKARMQGAVKSRNMPDIANETKASSTGLLDKVGMSEIEVPVVYKTSQGELMRVPAKASAFVSLDDANAKGIHMSRLFLNLQESVEKEELSFEVISQILNKFVQSHQGLSTSSYVDFSFEYMTKREALLSDNLGWRSYPMRISGAFKDGQVEFSLSTRILYSSTCPCSAALARQIIQENFKAKFLSKNDVDYSEVLEWLGTENAISATPHSQRSEADVEVVFDQLKQAPSYIELINICEDALQTAVQAAVKREDEQEFARRNGQNLMFCEDAARRLKAVLDSDERFSDFQVRVKHMESLHPHDAVAHASKTK